MPQSFHGPFRVWSLGALIWVPLCFCLEPIMVHAQTPGLQKGERIVFLGDSITEAGGAPDGYVTLVSQVIAKNHAGLGVEVINAGISGHRVPDLEKRLATDVLDKKPTLVVIYIGINDVWHSTQGRGTSKADYEAGLQRLIDQIQAVRARVVLCTPSVIGEKSDGSNPLDAMLDEFSAISRRVAVRNQVAILDLRRQFLAHLRANNPGQADQGLLTSDTVHLNPAGNQFVAARMLEALGVGEPHSRVLRHVVLFKFKPEVSQEQTAEVVAAFAALPSKIDTIVDFEHGTDVSVEGKSAGFTHGFVVTFRDDAGRAAYLPHPDHKKFVELVGPRVADVLVFDYWTSAHK